MADSAEIFNVVLGTAGHIDHGKSTLVQALTGIHPDRLKEEQERGITIDLGFAPLELSDGRRVGIIDVPGHERFIKNMVAGATGIDFVLMVVAADDGVMAQTREHLQIVQLLGVRDGLTVITKKDLVDAEMLELVGEDVRELEKGSVLEGKPVVAVSAKTGEGIAQLKDLLQRSLSKLTRRTTAGALRMPIQRVFAKEGFGTVVTGVPLSGHVALGDVLEILPPGYRGRVKGLHAYQHVIAAGEAGHSTAINLHGPEIDKKEVRRGMVVVTPGVFKPTILVTAWLNHLQNASWALKHRAPVRFHAGTAEIQGKVLLLEDDQLKSGTGGWIQVLLQEPTVLVPGDRFILRHQTPMVTLGGGRVVDVVAHKRKRRQPEVIAALQRRLETLDDTQAFLAEVIASGSAPKTLEELTCEVGQRAQELLPMLESLAGSQRIEILKPGALWFSAETRRFYEQTLAACMQAYFKEHPAVSGIERPELKRRLELSVGTARAAFFDELLAFFGARGVFKVESNLVIPPGRQRRVEGAQAELSRKVEEALIAGGLMPPALSELEAQLKIQPKIFREIKSYLIDTRRVLEARPDVHFHASMFEKARAEVLKLFALKPELTASEIRQHLGINRKYVVPLVELFDKQGVTVRVGDIRRLK